MLPLRQIAFSIGARGSMLLVLAALWTWLFTIPLLRAGELPDLDVIYYDWPIWLRVTGWIITSALAVAAAFVPPRKDWFGWVALSVMPAERMMFWGIAGVEHIATNGASGEFFAWYQTVLYTLLVTAVLVASAMRPAAIERRELQEPPA